MNAFPQTVEKEIVVRKLLPDPGPVLLAVSGGLDSMVLLQVMHLLAPQHGWKLVVAHFNHQLRGTESDLDQSFVQTAARQLDLAFVTDSGDVRGWAAESGKSLEMGARELRHQFLAKSAHEVGANRIALAHHADDQAELFLLRLLRGINGEGLGGMKWQNRSPAGSSVLLVRPLLGRTRAEIESYAASLKVECRQDATNWDARILRNRVRHELLPLLRSIEPKIENRLVQTAEAWAEQSDGLKTLARQWIESPNEEFDLLPLALQRTILHEQLIAARVEPTFQLIENLRLKDQEIFSVSRTRTVARERNGQLQIREITSQAFSKGELEISLSAPGSVRFSENIYSWSLVKHPSIVRTPNLEMFDAGRVGEFAKLRHWHPGDRFQPIGFRAPAKLQDLFTSAKVDAAAKKMRTLATTGDGTIFWVEGLRISELFKLTSATDLGLRWSWKP